jgi:hypothetical protein
MKRMGSNLTLAVENVEILVFNIFRSNVQIPVGAVECVHTVGPGLI